MPRAAFGELVDVVQAGAGDRSRPDGARCCSAAATRRAPVVEDPGTYAVRGGVIDVFVPLYRFPLRIELLGDLVESIRFFDPETQRTMRAVDEVYPAPGARDRAHRAATRCASACSRPAICAEHPSSKTRAILDQIDKGEDFFGVEALTPAFHDRSWRRRPSTCRRTSRCSSTIRRRASRRSTTSWPTARRPTRRASPSIAWRFRPTTSSSTSDELKRTLERRPSRRGAPARDRGAAPRRRSASAWTTTAICKIELERARAEKHEELLRPLAARLRDWRDEGTRALIAVPNLQHAERLESLLKGYQIVPQLHRTPVELDLFDRTAQRDERRDRDRVDRARLSTCRSTAWRCRRGGDLRREGGAAHAQEGARRRSSRTRCSNLEPGAYVVHSLHGVGVYKGLTKLPLRRAKEVAVDFLHLEYAGGDKLYLPVYRLNEIQKYSGAEGGEPKLDRLGGPTFAKTRARREGRAPDGRRAAAALRRAQACPATRSRSRRRRCTAPSRRPSRSTRRPISRRAHRRRARGPRDAARRWIASSAATSASARPRSRIRAAFRVAHGRQAGRACSAPTTVLAQQHFRTFEARMATTRSTSRALSRFQAKEEQDETLARPQRRQGRRRDRHAPPALEGRPLQAPRPARRRRGAALRRDAQGAHQGAAHPGRRAHALGDAHPAHAADGGDGPARPVAHHHAAGRSARGPHLRHALRRRTCIKRGDRARARARRAGLLRLQPHRGPLRAARAAQLRRRSVPGRAQSRRPRADGARTALEQTMLDFVEGRYDVLVRHGDHRERPRHPARQHDHHRSRRHVRPLAALPAARARRALEGARVLLPDRARRRTR